MNLFERVVSAQGKLLRVERYSDSTKRSSNLVPGLLMTFDVGRILIWGGSKASQLQLEQISNPEDAPSRLIRLDEKEPWWRVLGSPLVAVQSIDKKSGYRLQFRQNDRNPRTISLTVDGDQIRIEMKKASIEPSNKGSTKNKMQ